MPIRGYFGPVRPVVNLRGGFAGSGITVNGPVLEGKMSVDEAMVLSWIRGRDAGMARGVMERAGVEEAATMEGASGRRSVGGSAGIGKTLED